MLPRAGDGRAAQGREEQLEKHLKLHHVSREIEGWRLID